MRRIWFWKLLRISLIIFLTPFALALILTLLYSFIPPISIPIASRALSGKEIHWRWRSYDEINPRLARMVISAEDDRFCEHRGVDWVSMQQVAEKATKKGKLSRGASTIPMQTAKNLFLWPLPTVLRKPLEIPLAMWMDWIWSKQRMIEIYMNVAQFGPGIYGAEAASRFYFEHPASQLTSSEAAALASILPAPEKRNPDRLTPKIANYAATIKSRADQGLVRCLK